ncbi:MAG: DUF4384 domain-containing protein [Nitrospirales bacterium]|nr:DUF4384 domain-containing protein [Nitrospirales bacterium]
MKTHTRSVIATVLVATMLVSCTTPNGQGSFSHNNPCPPGGSQFTQSPWASFAKQAILNPLASIGGTVLATAAANYSQLYTGKLNNLLTKLVTPKKKKKKNQPDPGYDQGYYDPGYQQGQPDYNTGYPQTVDPNTGLPVQIDPNTGLPVQTDPYGQQTYPSDPYGQQGYPQDPYTQIDPNTGLPIQTDPYAQQGDPQDPYTQIDPNTGLPVQIDPNTGLPIEAQQGVDQGFDPNVQGGIQPRGVPGQLPHAIFSPTPCQQQGNPQAYSTAYPQNQPYGYDPNVAQQGQPYQTYPNDPNYQGQSYDPYGQPQGQNPYGQQTDPYAQQGYPQDPYAQQAYPSDPYAQQGYSQQDPYAQQTYQSDPYAQQTYPQDPNAQGYSQQDPYAQQTYSPDPYAQQAYPQQDPNAQLYSQQDPYAQQSYPQDSNTQTGTTTGIQTQETGTPIGMDVVLVKKTMRNGASVVLPIKDGDVLRDGRGNAKAGDKFRMMFRPNADGYVYVVAIDGSGWAQGIFPPATAPLANPVKAGEQYVLPEGGNWFSLDQFKGIETIFFVMSNEQRQDIEEILQSITGRERPASESPQQVTKVAMVPYGVGGARPSTKPFSLSGGSEQDQTIIPTSYLAQKAGHDLRLTRWFRHE